MPCKNFLYNYFEGVDGIQISRSKTVQSHAGPEKKCSAVQRIAFPVAVYFPAAGWDVIAVAALFHSNPVEIREHGSFRERRYGSGQTAAG